MRATGVPADTWSLAGQHGPVEFGSATVGVTSCPTNSLTEFDMNMRHIQSHEATLLPNDPSLSLWT